MARLRIDLDSDRVAVWDDLSDDELTELVTDLDRSFRERGGVWVPMAAVHGQTARTAWVPAARAVVHATFDADELPDEVPALEARTIKILTREEADRAPALGIFGD